MFKAKPNVCFLEALFVGWFSMFVYTHCHYHHYYYACLYYNYNHYDVPGIRLLLQEIHHKLFDLECLLFRMNYSTYMGQPKAFVNACSVANASP